MSVSGSRSSSSVEDLDGAGLRLERREASDVVQVVGRLPEAVDRRRLEESWRRTVGRYAKLRIAPGSDGGAVPVEDVPAAAPRGILFEDWGDRQSDSRSELLERWLAEDALRGFEVAGAPHCRLALLRFGGNDFRLVLSFHRALLDTRSIAEVLESLLGDPGEKTRSTEPRVEAPEAEPVRETAEEAIAAEMHWRTTLRGFCAPTPVPMLRLAGGAGPGPRRVEHAVQLSAETTRILEEAAAEQAVSFDTVLRGAWAVLLQRYSGESDVVFGVRAPADRPSGGGAVRPAVGNGSNTFPVRVQVAGSDPIDRWLRRLDRDQAAARPFERAALPRIRQWSDVSRGAPLFHTLLVLEGPRLNGRLRALGPEWRDRDFRILERRPCPIAIYCHPETRLTLRMVSDPARIEDEDAQRMLGHFARLLENLAQAPHSLLGDLSLMSPAEEIDLRAGGLAAVEIPEGSVYDLFEAQAARTPDRIAVSHGDSEWSYRELARRVAHLARYLQGRGVGAGVRVGLLMEPSLEMVAGLLAVNAAGGAYVPLDPAFPPQRLEFMATDSGLSLVLTLERLRAVTSVGTAPVVRLDSEWWRIEEEVTERPARARDVADSDAYVLYTSGSTGKPKGVQVTQRALVNVLWSMRTRPGIAQGDVFLALTTISFDIAGVELLLPLIAGARVALVDRVTATDALALRDAITAIRPTLLQATPSLWRMLVEAGWEGDPGCRVISGGEALDRNLADQLGARCASLWNGYGPTETTIYSTLHEVADRSDVVPIGRPVANTRVYVVDSRLRLLPRGFPGELVIGGVGVARGYLHRPDLTRERFVPNPFVEGGERLYRTGDLARFRTDGTLEYLGRTDHQVKIRGVRIELGEIDAALSRHPGVRQAVVVAREGAGDAPRLVAYLVVDRAREPRTDELRAFLAETLPEAMIPASFVLLDAFPLTPNGKVDRKALPPPGEARPELAAGFAKPVDDVERRLAGIWESVLQVRPIGLHDNFFDLGGDSLLALRLFTRIERLTGRRLPLATLLAAPTVATLAPYLSGGGTVSWRSLVTIQPGTHRPAIFCVPGIGGNAVGYYALARHLGSDQPVFGLQTPGLDGRTEPFTRVEDLASHYLQEIRGSGAAPPYHLAGASFGGLVAFEMARQLSVGGEEVGLVALFDSYAPNFVSAGSEGTGSSPALRGYAARLRFHLASLVTKPGRLRHLRGMARTLTRRVRSRVWQVAYRLHEEGATTRLPPYLSNVREAGYLASRRYAPAPAPLSISMFRASIRAVDDPGDPRLGWGTLAQGGVEVVSVPGDHLTMLVEPHVVTLAGELRRRLDSAASGAGTVEGGAG